MLTALDAKMYSDATIINEEPAYETVTAEVQGNIRNACNHGSYSVIYKNDKIHDSNTWKTLKGEMEGNGFAVTLGQNNISINWANA